MTDEPNDSGIAHSGNVTNGEMKNMKLSRKAKLGLLSAILIAAVAAPVLAWIASNTLHFDTTLSGSPFLLTSDPLPSTMYYETPIALNTETKNLANKEFTDVRTNYKIYRDGGAMDTSWITVHVKDIYNDLDLTFTVDGSGNLVAAIGPYTASATLDITAVVTVTFHNMAPLDNYRADVWVSVG